MKTIALFLAAEIFVSGAATPYIFTGIKTGSYAVSEEEEKTIVSRESFTGSYSIDSNEYENMNYVVTVYDDNSIEIKAQHVIHGSDYNRNYNFGEIWYPDKNYKADTLISDSSAWGYSLINKYNGDLSGIQYTYYSGSVKLNHGELFTTILTPKAPLTEQVTLDIFGHEVNVPAEPVEYDPYNDTDGNGVVDAADATMILQIYSANATGADIHNFGELNDWLKEE